MGLHLLENAGIPEIPLSRCSVAHHVQAIEEMVVPQALCDDLSAPRGARKLMCEREMPRNKINHIQQ